MGWSKKQIIKKAFAAIGFASYEFDLQPEQIQDALSSLDAMMASWNGLGIRLGYPLPSNPDTSNIDDDSCIPDWAIRAVVLNLALEIASSVGRQVMPTLVTNASRAYSIVLGRATQPPKMRLPDGVPAGAGHKGLPGGYREFLDGPCDDELITGPDGKLDFE